MWLVIALSPILVLLLLFLVNGWRQAWHTPEEGFTAAALKRDPVERVTVMAYNIGFCKKSDDCLDRVAAIINAESPDIVFLSQIYFECGPCAVSNQVQFLAEATGMPVYAFGENFTWGLPFYRVRAGNAILSRFPLAALETQQLVHRPNSNPFDKPVNRRRILWGQMEIGGQQILVGSLHNDSSDIDNNLVQAQQILEYIGARTVLLGGDFNAAPASAPMQLFRGSGFFGGNFDGPNTYPAAAPERLFDYVLAPQGWAALEHRVLQYQCSTHLPVVSTFAIPARD